MDDHQQIAFDSQIAVAVMGGGGEFLLVRLGDGSYAEAAGEARERGYRYCGVLGVLDGIPVAKCEPDVDSIFCCLLASLKFARLVCDRIKPMPKDDSVEFLARLYALPDTRDERYFNIASRLRAMSPN